MTRYLLERQREKDGVWVGKLAVAGSVLRAEVMAYTRSATEANGTAAWRVSTNGIVLSVWTRYEDFYYRNATKSWNTGLSK